MEDGNLGREKHKKKRTRIGQNIRYNKALNSGETQNKKKRKGEKIMPSKNLLIYSEIE